MKTLVTDAVPAAYTTWRASRRFSGGDPGEATAWSLTAAELRAVRATAVSPLALVQDAGDVIGIGKCVDVTTNRHCAFYTACQRAAIRQEPMTCRVRIDAAAEREVERLRNAENVALGERMLAVMREHGAPLAFSEIVAAVGVDTTDDAACHQARGALHRLRHGGRIVEVGTRQLKAYRKPAKTWRVVEADHA